MRPSITHSAGWLIVGLALWPLMAADANQHSEVASGDQRLERLLTMHDVRQAIHVQQSPSRDCTDGKVEHGR